MISHIESKYILTTFLKLAVLLAQQGITGLRVVFPKGTDANEFIVGSGNPGKSLAVLLEQALPLVNNVVAPEAVQTVAPVEQAPQAETLPYQQLANGELQVVFGTRQWRLKGWQKSLTTDSMKIHAQVRLIDEVAPGHPAPATLGHPCPAPFHIDQLELYQAKARSQYIRLAAAELGCDESVIKRDMGHVLLLLEQLQDNALQANDNHKENVVELDPTQLEAALALLRSGSLVDIIADDLAACGVVGERTNLLAGYLAAVSRKLDKPLAVLIQSSSAAGKSSLMEAVLSLMPEEERVQYSAMTGQSLFYLGETNLQHKILAIAEEEGVRQAAYALKLLQSDGELTIASTGKDEKSGELVTREYHVKGPVMLMLTTTAIDIDEELLNRCLVLSVNESKEQTEAIHTLQRYRQTLAGLLADSEKAYLTELHQNAQRLLKPLKVVNPYAGQLTFLSDKTRTRRDHMKYLTLIQSIALLHQYQREIKRVNHRGKLLEYIEVVPDDIRLANDLAHAILGRTLDEMPPQTRKLLNLIKAWITAECERLSLKQEEYRFSRRDVRAVTQWGDTQLKIHLGRLVEMEYLTLYRKGLSYEYSLLYDGEDNGTSHLCGLLDVAQLIQQGAKADKVNRLKTESIKVGKRIRSGSVLNQSEGNDTQPASGRANVGAMSGSVNDEQSETAQGLAEKSVGVAEKKYIRAKENITQSPLSASDNDGVNHG